MTSLFLGASGTPILRTMTHNATLILMIVASACSQKQNGQHEEQIRIQHADAETNTLDTTQSNSIRGNLSLSEIPTTPHKVVLTGLPQHRLVTVYKTVAAKPQNRYYDAYYYDGDSEYNEHFMPGIDLIHGYNLLNVAHYDLTTEKLHYLFEHPVLVKSLYYPSFEQDSLYKKPINRDYYLVSAYDDDTNADTLINKIDLRRFYYFNAACTEKIQLIPADYSVVRSQYDPKNDVMYVFARHDANQNGTADKKEPLHIFWLSLKTPAKAKRLY